MKKAVIMFIVFLIIDIILMSILFNFNGGKSFVVLFLPAMFMEIAVYGSFILYEVAKKKKIKMISFIVSAILGLSVLGVCVKRVLNYTAPKEISV